MARREDFSIRPVVEQDLEQVLTWRNSERVRTKMFEHHVIPWENHRKWFAAQGKISFSWIFEYRREAIGVITLKKVSEADDRWIWGCYLGDRRVVPKAGTIMGFVALEQFFDVMGVKLVIGEAVAANARSLDFNARLGFITARKFTQTTSTGENIPAVYLTMTRDEWATHRRRLIPEIFDVE